MAMMTETEIDDAGPAWARHDEDYVEQQIALMVAQLDRHIVEEPDAPMRAAILRLRPKAIAQIEQFARTALHVGAKH
jgi:hypothetical protein